MTISIQREKTFHPKCCRTAKQIEEKEESTVEVTYKVPSSEDFEGFIKSSMTDSEVYKKSILKVKGIFRSDNNNEVTERELPGLPGSRALVHEVCQKVLSEFNFDFKEKN
jgi:hypothetical protein